MQDFFEALLGLPASADAFHPYAPNTPNNARRLHNLRAYLASVPVDAPCLLMEAPGYRGCRLTGVPVTSRRVLRAWGAPYLPTDDADFTAYHSEQSATIVWTLLAELNIRPLLWNAFPLHPHQPHAPASNRAPRAAEIRAGSALIPLLLAHYTPSVIIAVGNVAAGALTRLSIAHQQVRHPAQGGKNEFVAGIHRLLGA